MAIPQYSLGKFGILTLVRDNMAVLEQHIFSNQQFLADVQRTAAALGAPYSESATRTVIEAYDECFKNEVVLWKTTSKPIAALNYRFMSQQHRDTIATAVKAGFIDVDNPLANLIVSWSSLFNGAPKQSCDFDTVTGLCKTWVMFGDQRPIEAVLDAKGVPASIRRHAATFKAVGLGFVRWAAVDYTSRTVNIYFITSGPLTKEHARAVTELADSPPPSPSEFSDLQKYLNPAGHTFAVTLKFDTGDITRVGFYVMKLPLGIFPQMEGCLETFFQVAPSYDSEAMNGVCWSYGNGGKKYMKAERSYCGEMVSMLRGIKTPLTAE